MIIKRLELNNFGVYAGANHFSFTNSKPIVLIGGMNGRGKTTFLEAVLLALYGENSFAYRESKYTTFGKYLASHVNTSQENSNCSIKLEFSIDANDSDTYAITRSWDCSMKRLRWETVVEKNGTISKFLTDNWAMFIENIFPSGIAGFYFFDGEKIAAQATDSTSQQTKESIKALLGLNVIDLLGRDLTRLFTNASKKIDTEEENKKLQSIQKHKNDLEQSLNKINDKITKEQCKITELSKKKEWLVLEYKSKGGELIDNKQELLEKRMNLKADLLNVESNLIDSASSQLPLLMVKGLLEEIEKDALKERDYKYSEIAIDIIERSFSRYQQKYNDSYGQIATFINAMKADVSEKDVNLLYDLQEYELGQLKMLLSNSLEADKENIRNLFKRKYAINVEINTINSYLDVELDEKEINRLYKSIKVAEQKIISSEAKIEVLQESKKKIEWEINAANVEQEKLVELILQRLELKDDDYRIVKYTRMAKNILEIYKQKLQKRKIEVLSNVMTDCFHRLVAKKDLINRILIDEKSIEFIYLDKADKEIPRESLSAGEKQLVVISLLWALAICSKKKLPVIIDTPLSRLDSSHRKALMQIYFPNASEQTIILSTDTEIGLQEYELMKSNICNAYTLVFDEDTKSTSVVDGYFAR